MIFTSSARYVGFLRHQGTLIRPLGHMNIKFGVSIFYLFKRFVEHKQHEFIPDIVNIVYKCDFHSYLLEFMLECSFVTKELWKTPYVYKHIVYSRNITIQILNVSVTFKTVVTLPKKGEW